MSDGTKPTNAGRSTSSRQPPASPSRSANCRRRAANHNPQTTPPTANSATATNSPGMLLCCVASIWLRLNSQFVKL